MTSPSTLEWTSQSMTGSPPPSYLLTLPATPLSHAFESTNPTWGLRSLQAPLTGGKVVGDEGALPLEPLDLELELSLPLVVAAVSLDLGVQSPVVELLGVGHQVVVPLRGADKEPVVPDRHGLDRLVDDLSGGSIERGDVHFFICVAPCEKVGLAIIATVHPFGLDLESLCNGDECGNLALIGLEIVGAHRFVLLLVLGKASTDFIETSFGGIKPPLKVLDLFGMVLVAFVEGAEEAIDKAPQIFRGHFEDSQRCGCGS